MKTPSIIKKAGSTKQEAIRNRPILLLEVEKMFRERLNCDPIMDTLRVVKPGDEEFIPILQSNLREAGIDSDAIYTDDKLATKLETLGSGAVSYIEWTDRRVIEENPAPSTMKGWRTRMRELSDFYGSEYLASITRQDAVKFKSYLLERGEHSTVRTKLNTISSFFNYAEEIGQVKDNVFKGLTKRLQTTPKKDGLSNDVLDVAKEIADSIGDLRFFIQYYTGCRKGEHSGLRYQDIDMDKGVINIIQWEKNGIVRRLKGGTKDERIVPIHDVLMEKLQLYLPNCDSSDSLIWNDYKSSEEIMGHLWANNFTNRYGFTSHQLRSYVITQLLSNNVSPYLLHEITRHSVAGMSSVVAGYVRPSMQDVRRCINTLT